MNMRPAFTLLEILLAISLLAVLGSFIFTTTMRTQTAIHSSQKTLQKTAEFLRAVHYIRTDLAHAQLTSDIVIDGTNTLTFSGITQESATTQSVIYRFKAPYLYRQVDSADERILLSCASMLSFKQTQTGVALCLHSDDNPLSISIAP